MNFYRDMDKLAGSICTAFGVKEERIKRLTLTLDWDGGLPTLEIETHVIEGMDVLAALLDSSGEMPTLTKTCGELRQDQYSIDEHSVGSYRRVSFPTFEELVEYLQIRKQTNEPDNSGP